MASDEYCPHCDNHFVLDAVTPKASLQVEGEDVRKDARYDTHIKQRVEHILTGRNRMLKDERVRTEDPRTIFNVKDAADRLG